MHEIQKVSIEDNGKKESLKGRGGGRLKYNNVDGDMPLCLRKTERKSKGGSSSNESENDDKSNMVSGSKDLCGDSTRKRNDEKTVNKEVTFIVLQKNRRSTHSSERIEEMVCELEGYRWDALLLSETWRQAKKWETRHKHIFMGAGRYDDKHGVGILLNKKWRQIIMDTEYINERAIATTIVVNRQRIKLMSVYFSHSKYADHHIEKMYKTIEKHTEKLQKIHTHNCGGDFNAELGLVNGNECKSVGRCTLNEGNKRGDG